MVRFHRDPNRDRDQRGSIHERGENLEPQQSEGAFRRGWPAGEHNDHK